MRYIAEDATLRTKFTTRQFSTGAPFTLAGTPSLAVYPEDSLTQITAGITLTADYDSVTGLNQVVIDLSADAGYAAGKAYQVVIAAGTVDSVSVVGEVVYEFYIHASGGLEALITRGLLALPAAAPDAASGLPISDAGGLDLDIVASNVAAVLADTGTDGVVVAAGSKTGYSLTATTGLGNQTADITGSLSGSVGSVTGAVGSVTGAVGSVTGNVGGNVTGSIGSLATQAKADVNAEVDTALNTAIPGSPTADSINERVRAMDIAIAKIYSLIASAIDATVVDGSPSSTVFETNITGYADNSLNDQMVIFESGDLDRQARPILLYEQNGSNGRITVEEAFTGAPANGDSFSVRIDHIHPNSQTADALLDRDASSHTTNSTLGAIINDLEDGGRLDLLVDAIKVITDALTSAAAAKLATSAGTIITGTVSNAVLTPTTTAFAADDITEATADHYNGRIIIFTSGALTGQATDITDYSLVSSEGNFTVTALTEAPANDDTFVII